MLTEKLICGKPVNLNMIIYTCDNCKMLSIEEREQRSFTTLQKWQQLTILQTEDTSHTKRPDKSSCLVTKYQNENYTITAVSQPGKQASYRYILEEI